MKYVQVQPFAKIVHLDTLKTEVIVQKYLVFLKIVTFALHLLHIVKNVITDTKVFRVFANLCVVILRFYLLNSVMMEISFQGMDVLQIV